MQRFSQDMDACWRMQMLRESASRQDVWKAKVEQVAEETDALRLALDRFSSRQHSRAAEEAQRQELLERRVGGGPAFSLDAELVARRHIEGSKRVLEEAYDTGVGILGSMGSQRERLKATHRKVGATAGRGISRADCTATHMRTSVHHMHVSLLICSSRPPLGTGRVELGGPQRLAAARH